MRLFNPFCVLDKTKEDRKDYVTERDIGNKRTTKK